MQLARLAKSYKSVAVTTATPENKAFRQHPLRGQELPSFVDSSRGIGEAIRGHHERFDGQGYPDGFAGETIP